METATAHRRPIGALVMGLLLALSPVLLPLGSLAALVVAMQIPGCPDLDTCGSTLLMLSLMASMALCPAGLIILGIEAMQRWQHEKIRRALSRAGE